MPQNGVQSQVALKKWQCLGNIQEGTVPESSWEVCVWCPDSTSSLRPVFGLGNYISQLRLPQQETTVTVDKVVKTVKINTIYSCFTLL